MAAKILVVDDSPTVRQQVRLALEHAGFTVSDAVDGRDALTKVKDGVSGIVCDMNMPNLNGVAFAEALNKDPKLSKLPIVMLTTEGNIELVKRAKQAGVKAWMIKPFKPDLLISAIRQLIGT
jgi:two-component system chemotaxis response regulator CheY